jgi:hypothetical protein
MKTAWQVIAMGLACFPMAFGCSPPPDPDPPPPEPPAWQVVLDGSTLDRAVLSVWGTSPSDVFAVGGPLGNGQETLAIHYDGSSWTELHPGGTETYWWVSGSSSNDVWMVGENGRITHWDGNTFTEHVSKTTATLWGVWAASAKDAWIVGGTPEAGTSAPNDVVLRWNGTSWTTIALPKDVEGRSLYKVWGTSSDDLYVVGEAATIWHKKGPDWILESKSPLATGTLFTVAGSGADDVYAVGSFDVLHSDGETWEKQAIELTSGVNGVACTSATEAMIVGFGGSKQRLVAGQWIDDFLEEPHGDLHAVWADGQGAYWAGGGNFVAPKNPGTSRQGIVARYGAGRVNSTMK